MHGVALSDGKVEIPHESLIEGLETADQLRWALQTIVDSPTAKRHIRNFAAEILKEHELLEGPQWEK